VKSRRNRTRTALAFFAAVGWAASAGCGGARPEEAQDARGAHIQASADAASPAAHALAAFFDEEWENDMREAPEWASELGDLRYDDQWSDASLAAETRRNAHDRDALAKLRRIDRAALSPEDVLSYDLFERRTKLSIEAQPFRGHLLAIEQMHGLQTKSDLAESLAFDRKKSYENWNARLRALPKLVNDTIETLREGARLGIVHPKIVMQRLPAQLDKQIVDDPEKSPFFDPYRHVPESIAASDRAALAAEAKRAIAESVVPAYKTFRDFFVKTYLPACKDDVGVWALPDGAARYAFDVKYHTTTSMTPDEVHQLGLREVTRIRGEMEVVKNRTGFSGSMKEFFQFLRTDPRFFKKTPSELLDAYRALGKRIDPELVKVFGKLPRTPYGVLPVPDTAAPDTTTAYYHEPAADGSRAGTYYVNLYKPEARPTWEMTALTLHESVPGHHLQIAIAMEQTNIPKFRRYDYLTAYVEGWALYAESLGDEIGMYDDPYAKFGQLTYEMWRAVRLVVDTGMHHLKWSRQKAIDYFMENAAKQELDVTNEIDRYLVWPGQALAYKVGELKIKELRAKQQAKLGAKWNEKAFHDAVLEHGALPLDVLEREVAK
jgi:uncharacterized protein (DUF885 family)